MRIACVKDKYKSPWYFMRVFDKLRGIYGSLDSMGLLTVA